ncbi:MAG: hypothetical protein K6G23_09195 [Lachnospiraceae bacterium]|nr:hypothetical protein [Lachnospiraceae bacterium]
MALKTMNLDSSTTAKKEAAPHTMADSYLWTILLLGILLYLCHGAAVQFYRDDAVFAGALDQMSFGAYLAERYRTWSSRIVLDGILVLLARAPFAVWKVCDTLVVLLLICSTRQLLGMPRKAGSLLIISILFAFVPFGTLSTAGYIATTVNYLWPLSFGVYALLPLRRAICGEPQTLFETTTVICAMLLAGNMELSAALLTGFYACGVLYLLWNMHAAQTDAHAAQTDTRAAQTDAHAEQTDAPAAGYTKALVSTPFSQLPRMLLVMLALAGCSVLYHLTCPGNTLRMAEEVTNWYPAYVTFSFGQKLSLGALVTFPFYVTGMYEQMIFPLLTGLLMANSAMQKRPVGVRLMAALTFLASLVIGFPLRYLVAEGRIWHHSQYYDLLANRYPSGHEYCLYSPGQVRLELILYVLLTLWLMLEIYMIFGKSFQTAGLLIGLGGGLASHLVIGFSPTVYQSATRAGVFMTATCLISAVYLVSQLQGYRRYLTIAATAILAAVSVYFAWAIVPISSM